MAFFFSNLFFVLEHKLQVNNQRKPAEKNHDDDSDDDDEDDEISFKVNPTNASRSSSSSLLSFETLEQHYEEVFRTSASNDPFGWRAGDSTSWRFTGSPTDPLSSSSSSSSSNDTLHLSLSSSASFRSSLTNDSRLRVYRSFDSLNLFDSGASLNCSSAADLSRSHNALDFEKEKEREQEEFVVRDKKLTATTANLSTIGDSPSQLARGKLARASFHCIPNHRDRKTTSSEALVGSTNSQHRASEPCLAPRPQQSAENLSEDSGFCDSRSIQVLSATPDSSDCSGGEESVQTRSQMLKEERGIAPVDYDDLVNFSYGAPRTAAHSLQSSTRHAHDDAHSFFAELAAAPTSDRSVYSPPCLTTFCKAQDSSSPPPEFSSFHQLNVKSPSEDLLEREWDAVSGMASRLPTLSVPNLYLGDDASLTHVPLKAGEDDFPRGRGVTFCPVVSEVSWRNSYSDSDSVDSSDPSTDEMSNRSLEDLCVGDEQEDEEEIEIDDKFLPALVDKVQGAAQLNAHEDVPTVNGNGSSVETQLVPPTLTPGVSGHVVTSDAEIPNAGRISTDLPVRDVHASDSDAKPHTVTIIDSTMDEKKNQNKSRFGGFFERFSFRRLSNRKSSKKEKKKAQDYGEKGTASVGVTTTTSHVYEDVTIIPLHGPDDSDLGMVAAPSGRGGKPPLPPRVPGAVRKTPPDVTTGTVSSGLRDGSRMPGVRGPTAIDSSGPGNRVLPRPLETDLDALEPADPEPERREGKKARSLMNLGLGEVTAPRPSLLAAGKQSSEDRARSMEFLLDKENQAAVMVSVDVYCTP